MSGEKGGSSVTTQGQTQDEQKWTDMEGGECEGKHYQQQKSQEKNKIVIPPVFLGPDPEFLPENQPPREPYYWEIENESGSTSPTPWNVKVIHNVGFYLSKALDVGEYMGEMVANILGLTQSKYQYVIDAIEFDQWMKEQHESDEIDTNMATSEGETIVECPGNT